MSIDVDAALSEVRRLADRAQPGPAESELRSLCKRMNAADLTEYEAEIRAVIAGNFMKKRRTSLEQYLDEMIRRAQEPPPPEPTRPARRTTRDESALRLFVRRRLADLYENQIFQWSTAYADAVLDIYTESRSAATSSVDAGNPFPVAELLEEEFARHSGDIFSKGLSHNLERGIDLSEGTRKSIHGCHRFMELPVQVFLADIAQSRSQAEARTMWACCSGMLTGIITGFGSTDYGGTDGWTIIEDNSTLFLDVLGFLRPHELGSLGSQMPASSTRHLLLSLVEPLAHAVYAVFSEDSRDVVCLPEACSYNWPKRQLLTVYRIYALGGEPSFVETRVILDSRLATLPALRDAVEAGANLVVTEAADDAIASAQSDPLVRRVLVSHSPGSDPEIVRAKAAAVLNDALCQILGRETTDTVLRHNFANDFPLENLTVRQYYRVHRSSVASMLRGFEGRNGIHLWCSPRRSGKSTACKELDRAGTAVVVYQTFAESEKEDAFKVLYRQVMRALDSGERIEPDFLREAISLAASPLHLDDPGARRILILDEYETLFGELGAALASTPDERYRVVKPLLDQLVAFSETNLLILVGMWPDAHYIMMEQNHLSMHVEQDPFPLFSHQQGSLTSEFSALVERAVGPVGFDGGFCDALYRETSGHPYLTVLALRHLFDWLIEGELRLGATPLTQQVFDHFADTELSPRKIAMNRYYTRMAEVIAATYTPAGQISLPWLYAVHSVMEAISRTRGAHARISIDEYESIWSDLGLASTGMRPMQVLRSGCMANFLCCSADKVGAAIPLLGRIAEGCRC